MARGDKVDFRFFLAKNGFFKMLPIPKAPNLPYDAGTSADYYAEHLLFRAVLDQAVHDLGAKDPDIREEAEEFFSPCNMDFVEVCELALLNPHQVYWAVKKNLDWISKSKVPLNTILLKFNATDPNQLIHKIMIEGKEHASAN